MKIRHILLAILLVVTLGCKEQLECTIVYTIHYPTGVESFSSTNNDGYDWYVLDTVYTISSRGPYYQKRWYRLNDTAVNAIYRQVGQGKRFLMVETEHPMEVTNYTCIIN